MAGAGAAGTSAGTSHESFRNAAGLTLRPRIYGELERQGTIVNFAHNRFFKRIGEASLDSSFTRPAFYVVVDKEAHAGPRNRAIIDALPDGEDTVFRVKHIKYGNHNAMWEVLSAHLYTLTGLAAPDSRLFIEKDPATDVTRGERAADGVPEILVASPKVTGYYDLGDFLVNSAARYFIDETRHAEWRALSDQIEEINRGADSHPLTADKKMQRIRLMEEIYKMLPDYFHREIEKSFAASKFIFNWDFANFDLNNIGVTFTLDRTLKVSGFKSVFVDFGNSGVIGFGGKYKEVSLDRANKAAKPFVSDDHEYDPELEISAEERAALAVPAAMATLSEKQQKSLWFKWSHNISSGEALMETTAATGLLSISDLPRNLPFGFLLRESLERKKEVATSASHVYSSAASEFFCDSEIEVAYRLSLISDEAIAAVVDKWYLSEKFADVFPIPEGLNPADFTCEKIIQIFKDRRNALASLVPDEVIEKWKRDNVALQLTAISEVELAAAKAARDPNPRFDELAYVPPSLWNPVSVGAIEREIGEKLAQLKQGSEGVLKKINALKQAQADCSGVPLAQEAIQLQINDLELSLEHKPLADILEFIESRLAEWKKSLRPKLDPSCDLFNLHRDRELYRATHEVDLPATPAISSNAENSQHNLQIHAQNSFVFEKFKESLQAMRGLELAPAVFTAASAAASSTPVFQRPRAHSI